MRSRPPGLPMRTSRAPTAAWLTCGGRTVEVSQAGRHVAGGEASRNGCRFSPERRRVFQPDQSWRHGDEASPCRHPGVALPPLPWSERSDIAVRAFKRPAGERCLVIWGTLCTLYNVAPQPSKLGRLVRVGMLPPCHLHLQNGSPCQAIGRRMSGNLG